MVGADGENWKVRDVRRREDEQELVTDEIWG